MSNLKVARRKTMDDSMIPMINIVFLLMIFFMVAGHIDTTANPEVDLPSSQHGTDISSKGNEVVEVALALKGAGDIYLNGSAISFDDMERRLAVLDPGAAVVSISADRNLSAFELDKALEVIRAYKISSVSLLVLQGGEL